MRKLVKLTAVTVLLLAGLTATLATINNSANKVVTGCNSAATQFTFSFAGVAAADISVILTSSTGTATTLPANQYTLALNAPVTGKIWGLGGTVTYPTIGSPCPAGSTITILRTLPFIQQVTMGNPVLPSSVESALDLIAMQVQQLNELIGRQITVAPSDPTPAALPPAAQRANQFMAFDGSGNPIAAGAPAGGVPISTPMQPVVNAVSIPAGRTALGLGTMAVENIGRGLQDDGFGNARVDFDLNSVSTSQNPVAANHLQLYIATGPIGFALPRANGVWNGYGFWVHVLGGGAVTLTPNVNDTIEGLTSGASGTLPVGSWAFVTTDGATFGNWRVSLAAALNGNWAPPAQAPTVQRLLSGSGTATPSAGVVRWRVVMSGGGAGGAGATANAGFPGTFSALGSWQALGGAGGQPGAGNGGLGGTGGTNGTGVLVIRQPGGPGQSGSSTSAANTSLLGGMGGQNPLAGAGMPAIAAPGGTAINNTGAGGAGGSPGFAGNTGAGGGAGEYVVFWVNNPTPVLYQVGTGGAGGASGGQPGGAGAPGGIIIEEFYS